nr:unnamed protein product [Digitaria exilis]
MEAGSAVQTQITWAPSARGRRSRHQASAAFALTPATAARRVRCRAMQQRQERPPAVRTVTIPFADLTEREKDLGDKIDEGLGPHGLGIISIADENSAALGTKACRCRCHVLPLVSVM